MIMRYIQSPETDPCFNLALEQHLFDTAGQTQNLFMLWQNENTVVVGKYQNASGEIDREYVKNHDVRVVRRLSGGGAVYHDMGNLNFTFITGADESETLDFEMFCKPVADTLAALGVKAELNGRNDITIGGKKFSGNAQYRKKNRVMHHGTILFDSDLEKVARVLRVSGDKITSKAIASVRSRVTNVREHLPRDMTLEEFRHCLVTSVLGPSPARYELTDGDLYEIGKLRDERYSTWEWNYGYSPRFSAWKTRWIPGVGTLQIYLDVKDGIIRGFESFGDYFGGGDCRDVAAALAGCRMEEQAVLFALRNLHIPAYYHNLTAEALAQVICG